MTTIVWAPGDLVVATSEGVDVRLAGVELTHEVSASLGAAPGERGVRIHVSGVRGMETQRRDALHLAEVDAWAARLKEQGGEQAGPPPTMPGSVLLLEVVRAVITDKLDTQYHCVSRYAAGTGTEWDGAWTFLPEPPPGVRHLTIEFTVDGEPTGKSCRVQLD